MTLQVAAEPQQRAARTRRGSRRLTAALTFAVLLALAATASAGWLEPVNGIRPISDIGKRPSIASIGGVPWVAWDETHGPINQVFVAHLSDDGRSWVKVGGPLNATVGESALAPTITGVGGVPYVVFTEYRAGTNTGDVRVARLNQAGNGWIEPWRGESATYGGVAPDMTGDYEDTQITSVGGVAYVAFDSYSGGGPRVARLDTSTTPLASWVEPWTGAGQTSGGVSPADVGGFDPSIAAINGVPYVSFVAYPPTTAGPNSVRHLQVRVARLNVGNSTWEQPWNGVTILYGGINHDPMHDAGGDPVQVFTRPALASINGTAYVAWDEFDETNYDIRVAALDTSTFPAPTWKEVSSQATETDGGINASPSDGGSSITLGAVDAKPFGVEVPYVSWVEYSGTSLNGTVRVARFDGTARTWQEPWAGTGPSAGGLGQVSQNASTPAMTTVNGFPYEARVDEGVRVSRLQPDFGTVTVTPSARGATVTIHAHTYGLAFPIGLQYGNALQNTTATQNAQIGSDDVTLTEQITGLAPATTYQVRPFALAGTPLPQWFGNTTTFTTTGTGTTTTTTTTTNRVPTLSSLSETHATFAVGRASTQLTGTTARRHARGTVFSFKLDQAATVTIAIRASGPGRRSGKRCLAPSRRLRNKPRCTRTVTVATLTRTAHAGVNKVAFSGRLRGKALKPGAYVAVFTPSNTTGASPPGDLGFTIAAR
jgi:hypothetical protein